MGAKCSMNRWETIQSQNRADRLQLLLSENVFIERAKTTPDFSETLQLFYEFISVKSANLLENLIHFRWTIVSQFFKFIPMYSIHASSNTSTASTPSVFVKVFFNEFECIQHLCSTSYVNWILQTRMWSLDCNLKRPHTRPKNYYVPLAKMIESYLIYFEGDNEAIIITWFDWICTDCSSLGPIKKMS